jgi:pimeloyl-ACP methyl ester carboxylesterase
MAMTEDQTAMEQPQAPVMAVETQGSGPDVVLFHGGMGCRKHWIRNIGPLSEHYTVHALDHPAYGESAAVPRDMSGADYLDLMYDTFVNRFPGASPLRFAGFSFGGAIAAHLAARLGDRVTHLCLISTAGLPAKTYAQRPTRSYRSAGDDEALFRDICRHNLLVNMLSYPESVTEKTIDIQAYCVRHTRFNSRKVSGGGTLPADLANMTCKLRVLWGEKDDTPYSPAADKLDQIRQVVGDLDLHRIPHAGHWSAYENAPEVNRLMLEFFNV